MQEIKRGTLIRVKKGTAIQTTGSVRNKVAGRTYVVKVDHVLSGVKITAHTALNDRVFCYDLQKYGIDEAALKKLRDEDPIAYHRECNIVIRQPSVRWAGTGGYWHEASIFDVEVV